MRMTLTEALAIEATYRGVDTSTLPEPQRRTILRAAALVAETATEALARISCQGRGGDLMDDAWMDISTAPKDGTWFDIWVESPGGEMRIPDVHFTRLMGTELVLCGTMNRVSPHFKVTHWREIPKGPSKQPPTDGEPQ